MLIEYLWERIVSDLQFSHFWLFFYWYQVLVPSFGTKFWYFLGQKSANSTRSNRARSMWYSTRDRMWIWWPFRLFLAEAEGIWTSRGWDSGHREDEILDIERMRFEAVSIVTAVGNRCRDDYLWLKLSWTGNQGHTGGLCPLNKHSSTTQLVLHWVPMKRLQGMELQWMELQGMELQWMDPFPKPHKGPSQSLVDFITFTTSILTLWDYRLLVLKFAGNANQRCRHWFGSCWYVASHITCINYWLDACHMKSYLLSGSNFINISPSVFIKYSKIQKI